MSKANISSMQYEKNSNPGLLLGPGFFSGFFSYTKPGLLLGRARGVYISTWASTRKNTVCTQYILQCKKMAIHLLSISYFSGQDCHTLKKTDCIKKGSVEFTF